MGIRVFDDATGEELSPEDFVIEQDDGSVATLEEDEVEEDEEPTLDDYVLPVIVEAVLDGRIPSTDEEFQEVAQLGLSLGVVVNTTNGLALARDVEAKGLELAMVGSSAKYAANFGKAFGQKSVGASSSRFVKGATRMIAKAKGRAATVARNPSAQKAALYGGAALGGAAIGTAVKKVIRPNALVANAEARNKK